MKSGDEDDEEEDDESDDESDDEEMKQNNTKKTPKGKRFAVTRLNAVQSQCYNTAFLSSENILLSAPTGAGKTNVAMLSILREIGVHLNADNETVRKDEFKIVYIAPMKSLVREVVLKFSKRLATYGIAVAELSGDQQLSREQIAETTVIVTTPEKWDIITRKGMDRSYAQLVKLIIIDEIHLLHDLRGSVLESIISRTIRNIEKTENLIRLIGLSATMPNYKDIADFLRVKYNKGLFVFNSNYRPIPLVSRFAGITLKKPFKQMTLMNELCYEYIKEQVQHQQQCIVFVHSRKETSNTAKDLLKKFKDANELQLVLPEDGADREILQQEAANEDNDISSSDLLEILPYGFGIHHAGMTREDRVLIEDLFKARVLKVLVSTATLAWGVNMPAHAVIIKGTQIYNPMLSKWTELSMLDILQMFGRAGRPDTGDKYGEAYLITTHKELKYYMPLLNDQLPIESQLVHRLPDCLNAEIVLGTVTSIKDAVEWLSYTYLNIRMKKSPQVYQLQDGSDSQVKQRLIDLAHSALLKLNKSGLIIYDEKTGIIDSGDLGRISSYYYVSYTTMEEYSQCLSSSIINDIELFKIFSLSAEFKYISVREGEKQELLKLLDKVPVPIKESIDVPASKINVLLQAYISRLSLDGFALKSDMCYIQQSAQRLMRALFEISLKRKWSYVAYRCLTICKMILHKQWSIESPLRQFGINNPQNKLTYSIINRIEKCQFSFDRFLHLSSAEVGELIRMPSVGKDIHKLIHQVPKLNLKGQIQPLTRSIIKIELIIEIDFEWNDYYHGNSQEFWVMVEDVDGETILHYEYFILYKKLIHQSHNISFTIPIYSPLPPQYFVRIVSDKWLGSTTILPISFRHLILPTKYKEKTELLDLQPLPIDKQVIHSMDHGKFKEFNSIQTQIFNNLYNTDDNMLLCAPSYSGKTTCAEIAITKMLNQYPNGKCVYLTTMPELVTKQYNYWSKVFTQRNKDVFVCKLNGDSIQNDLKLLNSSQIIITTPTNYDKIQRGWRKRKSIQNVNLFLLDNLHFIGINNHRFNGSIYEMVISRQKYIISALSIPTRIIGLSLSISNAKDLGDWLDVSSKLQYNFSPTIRPIRYQIKMKSSDINNFESRHISYIKQCYSFLDNNVCNNSNNNNGGCIIFVSSRKHCRRLASDLVALSYSEKTHKNNPNKKQKPKFLNLELEKFLIFLNKSKSIDRNSGLYKCLSNGIGFIHEHTDTATKSDVCKFYKSGAIKILIVVSSMCYDLELYGLKSKLNITSSVVLFGSKYYCGLQHNYIDYELCDMIQMMSFINRENSDNMVFILCHNNRESYLKKFLFDSYPIESHLDCNNNLEDALNAEIASETISNADEAIDFLTWTFYYFRLTQNPNYYNLRGISDKDLSQHLSELIEESFHRLYNANCISVDENMDVAILNNGLISSFYYITYTSIEFFYTAINKLISSKSKSKNAAPSNSLMNAKRRIELKNILSILSYATEFEDNVALRKNEETTIRKLAKHLPLVIMNDDGEYNNVSAKANVLLQTHFMRLPLKSADIANDRNIVLSYSIHLLYAIIDIMSTSQILNGVLISIELCQMIVQAMWGNDNYLLQLPYINKESAQFLKEKYDIKNIYDVLELEDEDRMEAFSRIGIADDKKKLNDIAMICNQYPDLELNYKVVVQRSSEQDVDRKEENTFKPDQDISMVVTVERESEEDDEDEEDQDEDMKQNTNKAKVKIEVPIVNCPRYPLKKYETWFLIVGDQKTNQLLFIKRFTMKTLLQKFKIKFKAPAEGGQYQYKLYLMSDSYLGCDQWLDFDFNVM